MRSGFLLAGLMLVSMPTVGFAQPREASIDRIIGGWMAMIWERDEDRLEDRARATADFWLTVAPSCDGRVPACRAAAERLALDYNKEYEARAKALLRAMLRDYLTEEYTPGELDDLAAFLTSSAGKKTPINYRESPAFRAALEKRSAEEAAIDSLQKAYQAKLQAETATLPRAPPAAIQLPR